MRIGLIAPLAVPVMRESTGSIEQLVWLLTEHLVHLGHEVTLFATGDSQTSARLVSSYPHGYEQDWTLQDWRFHESMHVSTAFEQARSFDVIHSHNYHFAFPFEHLVDTPVVHTYHVLFSPDILAPGGRYSGSRVVAISQYQSACLSGVADIPVVYNGIDTDSFPMTEQAGDYLVFLGRMVPWKGPVDAIAVARAAGMPLILAGPGGEYYDVAVAPLVDGQEIQYVGSVSASERNALLTGAGALVYPLLQPEPFGLVMVEAMACGTPVAALECGAVAEIVQQGITGFHATEVPALANLIPATIALDRNIVRDAAIRTFDYRHMTEGYLRVYEDVISTVRKEAL
ncbi:MAG: glycosyltransferase family 4 protein [Chloroflexota bacterium]